MTKAPITTSSTSVDVRRALVDTVRLDLVGPSNDHPFADERLPESPTRWYLTGYLVPTDAPIEQRFERHQLKKSSVDAAGVDDASEPDHPAARRSLLPSLIGLSVLVPESVTRLKAQVEWGDYKYEGLLGREVFKIASSRREVTLYSNRIEICGVDILVSRMMRKALVSLAATRPTMGNFVASWRRACGTGRLRTRPERHRQIVPRLPRSIHRAVPG